VAGGDWRLHEEREAVKGGGMRVYRLALPGRRFAWRDVALKLQSLLAQDDSRWGRRRREAFRAWAEARMWASIPPSEGLGDPVPSQRAMDVRRVLAHGLEETEGRVGLSMRKGTCARLLGRLKAS